MTFSDARLSLDSAGLSDLTAVTDTRPRDVALDAPPSGATADAPSVDARPSDTSTDVDRGPWYQVGDANCPDFCTTQGLSNIASPEGAHCISGENRPQSAIDQGIELTWGCWPDCSGQPSQSDAASYGGYCYGSEQKRDADNTDLTVGCFCG